MNERQAKALYDTGFWRDLTHQQRAIFQINEKRLCMPFKVFHQAVARTLNRNVGDVELTTTTLRDEVNATLE